MSQETELKLTLNPAALEQLRAHPVLARAPLVGTPGVLENTYYDTPELQLKGQRMALRTRRDGDLLLQTVKCASASVGGLSARPEWEKPFTGAFDFSDVDQASVRQLLDKLKPELVPVFTTHFERSTWALVPTPGVQILLMLDQGSIATQGRSQPLCEVELELVSGNPRDLYALALQLARDLPLQPEDVSKAQRGYRLFLGQAPKPQRARPSRLEANMSPVDAFRQIAFDCLAQWQGNASSALESEDPEFIHQLRVALRRLRSALGLFEPALPAEFVEDWTTQARTLAEELGHARDLDVMLAEILNPVLESGLADQGCERLAGLIREARERARARALQILRQGRHGYPMLKLAAELHTLDSGNLDKSANLATFARLQLKALRKKARKRHAAATGLEAERLHALRVSLKRLRYGLEFLLPLIPEKPSVRYLKTLAEHQDGLGWLNDEAQARAQLRAWAGEDPELRSGAAFVAGWHAPHMARLQRDILGQVAEDLWSKAPWRQG